MNSGRATPLSADLGEERYAMDVLWERALDADGPGGAIVTPAETVQLYRQWRRLSPRVGLAGVTLEVVATAATSKHGVQSDGFLRKIAPFRRRNVIELYPDDPEPEPNDVRSAA